jgi:hypothetical protein
MRIGRLVAISFGLLCCVGNSSIQAADKVVMSYSSRSYAFLPAQVAVARGFFEDENLEPLLIQMRSQVTVPTLMSRGERGHPSVQVSFRPKLWELPPLGGRRGGLQDTDPLTTLGTTRSSVGL